MSTNSTNKLQAWRHQVIVRQSTVRPSHTFFRRIHLGFFSNSSQFRFLNCILPILESCILDSVQIQKWEGWVIPSDSRLGSLQNAKDTITRRKLLVLHLHRVRGIITIFEMEKTTPQFIYTNAFPGVVNFRWASLLHLQFPEPSIISFTHPV